MNSKRELKYGRVPIGIINDEKLSIKAIGLYCIINAEIGCDNIRPLNRDKIIESISDGKTAFYSALNELKSAGLLKVYRIRRPEGVQGFTFKYCLLSTADKEAPSMVSAKKDGDA